MFCQKHNIKSSHPKNIHYKTICHQNQCTNRIILQINHFRTIPHKKLCFNHFLQKTNHYRTIFCGKHHFSSFSPKKQPLQDHSSPRSMHQHCYSQIHSLQDHSMQMSSPHDYSSQNSYYRTIFHQNLHYRTILSTFQYHQLSIAQNNITSGHQAQNTSSHLKDHPYLQHQYTHVNNVFQDHYPATVRTIRNKVFQGHIT